MPAKITAPVGKGAKNEPKDVETVKELLNPFSKIAGFPKLKVDGTATPKLHDAIGKFQLHVCGFKPDYRVDPGKRSMKTLLAGPSKAKAEQQKTEKAGEKAKTAEKEKARKEAAAAAEAARKTVVKNPKKDDASSGWDQLFKDLEGYAEALFEEYFGKETKAGKSAEEAAKKAAEQAGKAVKKKATEEAKKKQKEIEKIGGESADDLKPSRGVVQGPIAGVDKKIVNVLFEVSAFYEKPIVVTSGLRSPQKQGEVMFKYWASNLDRGKIYGLLKKDETLRKKLDDHFNKGEKKQFVDLIKPNAKWFSRHVRGLAVDIKKSTDKKMLDALGTVLRHLPENLCHHFDDRGKTVPSKIPESVKKTWKK